MSKQLIHILGPGSMGLLWGAYLSKSGWAVTLLHKNNLPENNQAPIILVTNNHANRYQVNHQLATNATTEISILLITVKAQQLKTALKPLLSLLTKKTIIILTQNGIGSDTEIFQQFPQLRTNPVLQMVCTHAALRIDDLEVQQTGSGFCWLGNNPIFNPNNNKRPKLKKLDSFLALQMINGWNPHIESLMWQKLVVNACINPLSTILGCCNGELLHKKYQSLVAEIVRECCDIAQYSGLINVHLKFKPDSMLQKVNQVCTNTSSNRCSMLEDIFNQRSTEINYINQHLINLADKHRISAPWNLCLTGIINTISHAKID